MSAQQDRESVVKALNSGALGFIPKSTSRKVILGALQLVISGGIYTPPQALAQEESSAAPSTSPNVPTLPAETPDRADQTPVSPANLGLTGANSTCWL